MKPLSHWLNRAMREMPEYNNRTGPQPLRIIAERSGLAYTTIMRAADPANTEADTKLTTADRIIATLDMSISDVCEYLEDEEAKLLQSSSKPAPILMAPVLEDTEGPDAMRYMFSGWLHSTLRSYDISARDLSHMVGKSESYVSSITNSRKMVPSLQAAEDICNALKFRLCSVLRELEFVSDLVYFGSETDEAGNIVGKRNLTDAKAYLRKRAEIQEPKLRKWKKARAGG